MPIALYAATQVVAMFATKFGKDEFVEIGPLATQQQDRSFDHNSQSVIVQLDVLADNFDKGVFPGLHWLEDILRSRKLAPTTSIIITAWNADIFAPGSAVRLRAYLGAHPRSNLLSSPLIKFVPLAQLMRAPTAASLREYFPRINRQEVREYDRLLEDIQQNCYTRWGIASQCHRMRHMIYEYWQVLHPEYTAKQVFKRFEQDFASLSVSLLQEVPKSQREALAKKVQNLHKNLKQSPDYPTFKSVFLQLEKALIPFDKAAHQHYPKLNTNILIISADYDFVATFIDNLTTWGVRTTWVRHWEEAETILEDQRGQYACLFSNFRNSHPNGKMTTYQGYENLYSLRDAYPLFPSAFLTSMSQAQWEQPGYDQWPAFDLKALTPFSGKSVYALYFFLKNAEKQRINRVARTPRNCQTKNAKNAFQDMHQEGMAGDALAYLNARIGEARQYIRAYCQGEVLGVKWPISTRYITRNGKQNRQFVFERLFYRLCILGMLRQPCLTDGSPPPTVQERRQEVNYCIWSDTDRSGKESYANKGADCSEYLRIDQSVPFHTGILSDLYRDGHLFYHEYLLLPKLEILPEDLH